MNALEQLHINKRKFDNTREFNNKFLCHVKQYIEPREIPANFEFSLDNENLIVKGFGYEAKAKPRFVIGEDGFFAVEYTFHVQIDDNDEKIEVFRFYLTNGGRIIKLLESDDITNNICDFNNERIASHICCGVLDGIINSSLFAPSNAIKE